MGYKFYTEKDNGDFEFSGTEVVGIIQRPSKITADDIDNIITNSLEGGSTFWLGINNTGPIWEAKPKGVPISTWVTKNILDGKEIEFYDIEDEDEKFILNLEKLMKGIELKLQRSKYDIYDMDGGDCDDILQYAFFGEIVYG